MFQCHLNANAMYSLLGRGGGCCLGEVTIELHKISLIQAIRNGKFIMTKQQLT